MHLQLITPSPLLEPYVQFYGLLQADGRKRQPIEDLIPPYPGKGLIFSLEEYPAAQFWNSNLDFKATTGYFMPQCTQSWRMHITGKLRQLGVFFRPGMFRHFFNLQAARLTDQVLTFSEGASPAILALQERLLGPEDIQQKIAWIESFLLQKLARSRISITLTDHAFRILGQHPSGISIDNWKNELGVSGRYFRKIFYRDVGIPPKTFLKIQRFHRSFNLLKAKQFNKLSDIAYRLDYFDQSHFIKEFKQFTSFTPSQLLQRDDSLLDELYWREVQSIRP